MGGAWKKLSELQTKGGHTSTGKKDPKTVHSIYQTKLVWFSNDTIIRLTAALSSSKMLPGLSDKWFKTMGSCHEHGYVI